MHRPLFLSDTILCSLLEGQIRPPFIPLPYNCQYQKKSPKHPPAMLSHMTKVFKKHGHVYSHFAPSNINNFKQKNRWQVSLSLLDWCDIVSFVIGSLQPTQTPFNLNHGKSRRHLCLAYKQSMVMSHGDMTTAMHPIGWIPISDLTWKGHWPMTQFAYEAALVNLHCFGLMLWKIHEPERKWYSKLISNLCCVIT